MKYSYRSERDRANAARWFVTALAVVTMLGGVAVINGHRDRPMPVVVGVPGAAGTNPVAPTTGALDSPAGQVFDDPAKYDDALRSALAPEGTPAGKVAVGKINATPDGKALPPSVGYVDWQGYSDGANLAAITDRSGRTIGYWGHELGWLDLSVVASPGFDYQSARAAKRAENRAQAERQLGTIPAPR